MVYHVLKCVEIPSNLTYTWDVDDLCVPLRQYAQQLTQNLLGALWKCTPVETNRNKYMGILDSFTVTTTKYLSQATYEVKRFIWLIVLEIQV